MALEHFRCHPEGCTFLRLSLLFLLGEKGGETQVTDLDLTVSRVKDVVALDVPVQHVHAVHLGKTERNLIQRVSAKVFGIALTTLRHNIYHRALVHILQYNEHFLVEIVQLMALNQLLTVEVCHQLRLLQYLLQVSLLQILYKLQSELFPIG